jgi:hypothetical protein
LASADYELVCVSAIEVQFQAARLDNLRHCGFPIERVIATANADTGVSPKAAALREPNGSLDRSDKPCRPPKTS